MPSSLQSHPIQLSLTDVTRTSCQFLFVSISQAVPHGTVHAIVLRQYNPAHYPLCFRFFCSDAFYTTLYNTLDYTCAGFPVTFADKELDKVEPPHEFRNNEDEAVYKLCTSLLSFRDSSLDLGDPHWKICLR